MVSAGKPRTISTLKLSMKIAFFIAIVALFIVYNSGDSPDKMASKLYTCNFEVFGTVQGKIFLIFMLRFSVSLLCFF